MNILIGQLDFTVADIDGNLALMQSVIDANQDPEAFILFPELAVCGYIPEDWLHRPSFARYVTQATAAFIERNRDVHLFFGLPYWTGGVLYNAVYCQLADQPGHYAIKQCLPNDGLFDERRYFRGGDAVTLLSWGERTIAVLICEDIWDPKVGVSVGTGVDVVFSFNASPFHHGKAKQRLALLQERAVEIDAPIVYVQSVGVQDEFVFDGGSMMVDALGRRIACAPFFETAVVHWQLSFEKGAMKPMSNMPPFASLIADKGAWMYQALCFALQGYCRKNNFEGVVVGLSGGIDSAVSLSLAVDALGAKNVTAVFMPFRHTSKQSQQLAAAQAQTLGVTLLRRDITQVVDMLQQDLISLGASELSSISYQNIQARARAVILMGLSNQTHRLLLTTGNKSELAMGFATIYGDMAGGYNLLKDVYKGEVYQLAHYRNRKTEIILQDIIDREPTAELLPGQLDADSLPSYDVLDAILRGFIEEQWSADAIAKRYDLSKDWVLETLRRVLRSEHKRRQAVIGPRVSECSFGRERRYPISAIVNDKLL